MKLILNCLPLFFIFSMSANAQNTPSPEAETFFNRAMSEINVKHVNWVKISATEFNSKQMKAEEAKSMATNYAILGSMSEGDIEALAFLVLMQASKSAQEDLKTIMARVKTINNAKAKQRELLQEMQQHSAKNADKQKSEAVAISGDLQRKIMTLDSFTNIARLNTIPNRKMSSTKGDFDQMINKMKMDMDLMSKMGESESLKLQKSSDRVGLLNNMISIILKNMKETQSNVIRNLK